MSACDPKRIGRTEPCSAAMSWQSDA